MTFMEDAVILLQDLTTAVHTGSKRHMLPVILKESKATELQNIKMYSSRI